MQALPQHGAIYKTKATMGARMHYRSTLFAVDGAAQIKYVRGGGGNVVQYLNMGQLPFRGWICFFGIPGDEMRICQTPVFFFPRGFSTFWGCLMSSRHRSGLCTMPDCKSNNKIIGLLFVLDNCTRFTHRARFIGLRLYCFPQSGLGRGL